MIQYSDIHPAELKNLSVKSFTQVLINDYYPFIYDEIYKLEANIAYLQADYDVDVLSSLQKKIYSEFDELYRKEKLVLFPYIIKLDEENCKSENCAPFKNTKHHYTSMVNHITTANQIVSNYFVNDTNDESIAVLHHTLLELKECMMEIQMVKEKYFFNNYKTCGGCKSDND